MDFDLFINYHPHFKQVLRPLHTRVEIMTGTWRGVQGRFERLVGHHHGNIVVRMSGLPSYAPSPSLDEVAILNADGTLTALVGVPRLVSALFDRWDADAAESYERERLARVRARERFGSAATLAAVPA